MRKVGLLLLIGCVLMGGCGESAKQPKATVTIEHYDKKIQEYLEITRGDFVPMLKLKLQAKEYERLDYFSAYNDMELEEVYVTVGQRVKKGDKLIRFKSEDLEKQYAELQEELERSKLLLEHYENLDSLHSTKATQADLENLRNTIETDGMYISELQERMKEYTICAQKDGTVTRIVDWIMNTGGAHVLVDKSVELLTVTSGSDEYVAITTEEYPFTVGEYYPAMYGYLNYQVELLSVEENGGEKQLTFRYDTSAEDAVSSEFLDMELEMANLQGVISLPVSYVLFLDEGTYVYVLDGEYRRAVPVVCGNRVGDTIVIEKGLEIGDKVVMVK